MEKTDKPSEKVQCELTANILLHFSSDPRPFDVFENAIDLNKLISHIVAQSFIFLVIYTPLFHVCFAVKQNIVFKKI